MSEAVSRLETWENLFTLFTEERATQPDTQKMLAAITAYRKLDIRATADGLTDEQRQQSILEGLMADALVDSEDKEKAAKQLRIIEQGYKADPAHWEKWMGRRRKFRMDIMQMHEELSQD